jgi:hypothetical protein
LWDARLKIYLLPYSSRKYETVLIPI